MKIFHFFKFNFNHYRIAQIVKSLVFELHSFIYIKSMWFNENNVLKCLKALRRFEIVPVFFLSIYQSFFKCLRSYTKNEFY